MTERQLQALTALKRDLDGEDRCDDHLPVKVGPARDYLLKLLTILTMDAEPVEFVVSAGDWPEVNEPHDGVYELVCHNCGETYHGWRTRAYCTKCVEGFRK